MSSKELHAAELAGCVIESGLSKAKRECLTYSLREKLEDTEFRLTYGRPLFGILVTDNSYAIKTIPFYVVEEPRECSRLMKERVKDLKHQLDFDPEMVAAILNDEKLNCNGLLIELCFLALVEHSSGIRKLLMEIDQSRFDPVIVTMPKKIWQQSFQLTTIWKLPVNDGLLQMVDD